MKRGQWTSSNILIKYHDAISGKEEHDDEQLFKMLFLEGL